MQKILPSLSGQLASKFAFGTMQFGGGSTDKDAEAVYNMCREAGINVFDTAYGYTGGKSEETLGKLIAQERDDIVVMSKCAHPAPSTPENIRKQFDESRKRLNQDMIDILFLHRWDGDTPLEETLATLAKFKSDGAIRSIGVSNFSAWQVMKAQSVAASLSITIDVIQPMYSLVKRQVEVEILPMAQSEGIATTPYSPLGGGLLTGKYQRGESGRLKENPEYAARYAESDAFESAEALTRLAADRGVHPATLAVAWVSKNPAVTATLISGKNAEQFAPSLKATKLDLTAEDYDMISALSRTPPPATDRLEEQTK